MVDHDGRWLYTSPSYARILDAERPRARRRRLPPRASRRRRAARAAARARLGHRQAARRSRCAWSTATGACASTRPACRRSAATAPRRARCSCRRTSPTCARARSALLLAAHAFEGMTEAIVITAADGTIAHREPRLLRAHRLHARRRPRPARERDPQRAAAARVLRRGVRRRAREGYWSGHHLGAAQERRGVPRMAQRARGARRRAAPSPTT